MDRQIDEKEIFGTGWQKWSPQAWVDYFTVKIMMSQVGDVIPKTYMPILRLVCNDPDEADVGYERVRSLREPIRFLDSPRDKWRIIYGSYVRELDWVYGELNRYFPQEQYEELVIDIMARTVREGMASLLPSAEKVTRPEKKGTNEPTDRTPSLKGRLVEKLGSFVSSYISPVNGIVGPVEQKEISGGMEMYIPHCWMHAAPCDGRTMDRACVEGCKGSFEAVFNGRTPVAMSFEPHLPEYSCTLTIKTA